MAVEVAQNEEITGKTEEWREKRSQFCHPSEKSE